MKLLTIDTSTTACSVALTDGERLLGEYLLAGGRAVSSRLFDAIGHLMKDCCLLMSDLDGFGVSLGPGAFTGLRVGIAAVKGMALATGKPVAGFSSLAMLAMNLQLTGLPICPMFDARRAEVYAGLYRCSNCLPHIVKADAVLHPTLMSEWITEPTLFIGDGALRYREQLSSMLGDLAIFSPSTICLPRASNGALIALASLLNGDGIDPSALLPVYLRLPEAELAKKLL